MLMRNLHKHKNKITKSQKYVLGSLLIFLGIIIISSNYLLHIRDEVFSDMKIAMIGDQNINTPSELDGGLLDENGDRPEDVSTYYETDYSKYLGVLEIPTIRLKRGFYGFNSRYNNIQYNVTLVRGSSYPDEVNGNTILMAHSGTAYISYFANLYRMQIGDAAYLTYNGVLSTYRLVNVYNVPKIGVVDIYRNPNKTCLTLITCTKDSDNQQSVYILERE